MTLGIARRSQYKLTTLTGGKEGLLLIGLIVTFKNPDKIEVVELPNQRIYATSYIMIFSWLHTARSQQRELGVYCHG